MFQAPPVHQVRQAQAQAPVHQVLHQVHQNCNLCLRPMYPIFLLHHHHLPPHLHHLPHLRLPHLLPHLRRVHPRSSSPVRPTPPPAPPLHLHRPHHPLHHLQKASTTMHHCRSPLGRTQAQVRAQECRSGARPKARRHSIWNGPVLLLQLLNLLPLHLLHRLQRPLLPLGLLSLPLKLLSEPEEAHRHSQQQREEQQQQQNQQQQRKKQPQQRKKPQQQKKPPQQHLLPVVVFSEVAVQANSSTKFFLLSNFSCAVEKRKKRRSTQFSESLDIF